MYAIRSYYAGYGAGGGGKAALLSMLQSCSTLAVVNIDAGFVAGAYAARIANMIAAAGKKENPEEAEQEEKPEE